MSNAVRTIESYEECYSDFHKEAFGTRPRHDTSTWTLEDWAKEFEVLGRICESNQKERAEAEKRNIAGFHAEVAKLIRLGAADEKTAIRWIADAEDCTQEGMFDPEYLDHTLGVPFGFIKARLAA